MPERGKGLLGVSWLTGDSCPAGCPAPDRVKFVCDEVEQAPGDVVLVRGVLVCEVCGWWDDLAVCRVDQIPAAVLAEVLEYGGTK